MPIAAIRSRAASDMVEPAGSFGKELVVSLRTAELAKELLPESSVKAEAEYLRAHYVYWDGDLH